MSYNFGNVILIVVFNYSSCINNKSIIKTLYEKNFKKIIFYSDLPIVDDEEVNFIYINKGFNTHYIFKHFYQKYFELINQSDGVFYTMDDNILNMNILNLYSNDKIIYFYNEIKTLENYSGWWWANEMYGKNAIINLMIDPNFSRFNINKFSGEFSDFFYLPKRYWNNDLVDLFGIFAIHNVFLEIAIPSIINNIEQDRNQYQKFTAEILWGDERNNFKNPYHIYHSLNHNHNLFLHPIKFNENPDSKMWLSDFFNREKCVIITTINKPSEAIIKHINNSSYDVIIVGDNKTPDEYNNYKCIYLNISNQNKLFNKLSELTPSNHYCRKNLGYLYAIKKKYKSIYETDDDNIPYDNFDEILNFDKLKMIEAENNKWINIFKHFTNNGYIWPRGFPLSLIKKDHSHQITTTDEKPSIVNGLVENDPDVDALFRIICNHNVTWEKDQKILVSNKNVCVFNTQNTFWLNQELFITMLIPSSVSFRYCDILRGIICNIILNKTNNYMMYTSPNVTQIRNEHNLISDFKSEYEMYIHNENILDIIDVGILRGHSIKEMMIKIYDNLISREIMKESDKIILIKWFEYFD